MRKVLTMSIGLLVVGLAMGCDTISNEFAAERIATESARTAMMSFSRPYIDPECEAPVSVWIEIAAAESQRKVLNGAMQDGASYDLVNAASLAASRVEAAYATAQYQCDE